MLLTLVFSSLALSALAGATWLWWVFGCWALMAVAEWRSVRRKWQRRCDERVGEDIGTFSRAFDRKSATFDPKVIRVAWDEFSLPLGRSGAIVPARPDDRLEEEFDVDDPTFVANQIAERAGRSTEAFESTPVLAEVLTIRDLVRVVSEQPIADHA